MNIIYPTDRTDLIKSLNQSSSKKEKKMKDTKIRQIQRDKDIYI